MTTDRQKRAIEFCNNVLSDKFKGDIDNFAEVSDYLSKHLENAKSRAHATTLSRSYESESYESYERLHDYGEYISEDDFEDIVDPYWIVE